MKKIIWPLILLAGIFLCLSPANAALLGVELLLPDILSNQTGTYTYFWDAGNQEGLFTSTATPLTITTEGDDLIPIPGKTEYLVSFWLDGSGNFKRGLEGDDLTISGEVDGFSGDLLTGEVTNFGWFDVPGSRMAIFDFTFRVTGGLAAEFYQGPGGDIMTAEISNFADDWQVNHGGIKVKHNTAPVVPIPGAAWLLGAGLIGLVALRRKYIG